MRVFIYNGGLRLVGKSGVGQAIFHQREMLRRARIETTHHWLQRAGAVHINTVLPTRCWRPWPPSSWGGRSSTTATPPWRTSGAPSGARTGWPPLPAVDHLLLRPGRRGADAHGLLPPPAGELRPEAPGVQHLQRRGHGLFRPDPPGGTPSAAGGISGKGSGPSSLWATPLPGRGCRSFWTWRRRCRTSASSGSAGPIPA